MQHAQCPSTPEQLARWRLILGKDSQESLAADGQLRRLPIAVGGDQLEMDEALEAIYAGDERSGHQPRRMGVGRPKAGRTAPSRAARSRRWPAGSIRSATSFPRTSSCCCSRTPSSGAA